jgi:hypothetical protein
LEPACGRPISCNNWPEPTPLLQATSATRNSSQKSYLVDLRAFNTCEWRQF